MLEKLKEMMLNYVDNLDGVTEKSTLISDIGMSSMDFLVFVGDVEDEFGIKIPDKEFVKLQTLEDFMRIIEEKK